VRRVPVAGCIGGNMAKTLLLADDSVTIQKVVNISFASEDVTLVTVDNGDDAIARAIETRPDLILADVVMPGKNGYEVCEAIKANPDLAHIPVLLLTGTFEAFDEERANRAGAAGHVAKPFEAQMLVEQVNRLLAQAPPPAAPAAPQAAPVAPPEAVTAPSSGEDSNEDSFDFFDDDLNDLGAPPAPEAQESANDAVRFDDSDSAFAFGDEEVPAASSVDDNTPADFFAMPEEDSAVPDRTVAILPDDASELENAFAAPIETPPTALDAELGDMELAGDEEAAELVSDAEDSFAPVDPSPGTDDAFDFSFESASAAADPALDGTVLSVEAADLVQATVLDPKGSSGYDVSSSDLGDPFDAEPVVDAAPSMLDAVPSSGRSELDEPVSDAEMADPSEFETDLPPEISASAEPERSASAFDVTVMHRPMGATAAPSPEPDVPDAEFAVPEPAPVVRPRPDDAAARADSLLAQITPALREQLHDTLEKAAWESFGSVTEKIVAETVDRVEKIAWEVIPQLAEALIKEEIRRIKGELDD